MISTKNGFGSDTYIIFQKQDRKLFYHQCLVRIARVCACESEYIVLNHYYNTCLIEGYFSSRNKLNIIAH